MMSVIQAVPAELRFIGRVRDAYEEPGVYALWCREGKTLTLLNVKESENIKITLLIYHRLQIWQTHTANRIVFSACYTPRLNALERRELADKFKKELAGAKLLR